MEWNGKEILVLLDGLRKRKQDPRRQEILVNKECKRPLKRHHMQTVRIANLLTGTRGVC